MVLVECGHKLLDNQENANWKPASKRIMVRNPDLDVHLFVLVPEKNHIPSVPQLEFKCSKFNYVYVYVYAFVYVYMCCLPVQ